MTGSRDFKRLVRKRMAETGESYTVARAHFDAPPKKASMRRTGSAALASVASYEKRVYGRRREKDLASHLEREYDVRVSRMTKLDLGVYRVDLSGRPSWVARLFPAARSMEAVRGDSEILAYLERVSFPAERLVNTDPVSTLAGQPMLITKCAPGSNRRSDSTEGTIHTLGSLLGRLHTLPVGSDACTRPAGSWHHLSVNGGGRRSDIAILLTLLDDAETRAAADERALLPGLREELQAIDDLEDLPKALTHPDPCGANLIALDDDEGVLVDWTGAGRAARIAAFANLIGSVTAFALVDAAVAGYRQHTSLEECELDRLEGALIGFPMILDCWTYLFQGASLRMLTERLTVHRQRAAAIASCARSAFATAREPMETKKAEDHQGRLF